MVGWRAALSRAGSEKGVSPCAQASKRPRERSIGTEAVGLLVCFFFLLSALPLFFADVITSLGEVWGRRRTGAPPLLPVHPWRVLPASDALPFRPRRGREWWALPRSAARPTSPGTHLRPSSPRARDCPALQQLPPAPAPSSYTGRTNRHSNLESWASTLGPSRPPPDPRRACRRCPAARLQRG
eukprot:scaffold574_cov246-Pinguiococcus_pyrenoidosus.AAC.18